MGLVSPCFPGCPGTPRLDYWQLAALPAACVLKCVIVGGGGRGGTWWGSNRPTPTSLPPYPSLTQVSGERKDPSQQLK